MIRVYLLYVGGRLNLEPFMHRVGTSPNGWFTHFHQRRNLQQFGAVEAKQCNIN